MTSHYIATNRPFSERPTFWWGLFVLTATLILAFVPYANAVQKVLRKHLGAQGLRSMLIGLVVVMAVGLVVFFVRRRRVLDLPLLARMVPAPVILGLLMARLPVVSEAFHLVEYGILGAVAFRALSLTFRHVLVYLLAIVLTASVGALDELVQWLTPGRFWGWNDIALNLSGGVLAQLWIALAFRPSLARRWPTRGEWRWALAAALFFLTFGVLFLLIPVLSGPHPS